MLRLVHKCFLPQFAITAEKRGGEFCSPRCALWRLIKMFEPSRALACDPFCGSSYMLKQSVGFVRAHANGDNARSDISIYGKVSVFTTGQLTNVNLAIGEKIAHGDSFHSYLHSDQKAEIIFANPLFNILGCGGEQLAGGKRWLFGAPPKGNANVTWAQHLVVHFMPKGGLGFVLTYTSVSSSQASKGKIRKNLIGAGLVECMAALLGQLFYLAYIPACLRILMCRCNRRVGILFIHMRKLERIADRTHRALIGDETALIANSCHKRRP